MGAATVNFGGDIPGHYDRGLGPVIFEDYGEHMARLATGYRPKRVLELAGGTGIVSRRLRNALPSDAHLTVTDLSPAMLEVAKSKFAPGETVSFLPADACDLPFDDGAFDLIVCQFGVMFFPDKARGYAEAFRVLAPGGHYLLSVWDSQAHNRFGAIAQQALFDLFDVDPPTFYQIPFGYHSIDAVREGVDTAGFREFSARVVRIDKAIADLAAFADGLVFGNPLADQLRARGVDLARFHADLATTLKAEFGDPARTSLQALFFEAIRP